MFEDVKQQKKEPSADERDSAEKEYSSRSAETLTPFRLLNADGTPLEIDSSSSESDEETQPPQAEAAVQPQAHDQAPDTPKELVEEENRIRDFDNLQPANAKMTEEAILEAMGTATQATEDEAIDSPPVTLVDENSNNVLIKDASPMCKNAVTASTEAAWLSESAESEQELFGDSDPECDFSEYRKFLQFEELLRLYQPVDEVSIKAMLSEILYCRERKPVELSLILKKKDSAIADKIKALKDKKDTPMERVRNELNRVTETNLNEVITNLQAIKVEKVSDMKEIAAFVFEKAINEVLYLKIYSTIVSRLKKTWKCSEELSMTDKSQTCFFGTLVKYMVNKITAKQNWAQQLKASEIEAASREELEEKLEDAEAERLFLKKQYVGSVKFLIMLYDLNIIGPQNVISVISTLLQVCSPEYAELLCLLCSSLAQKLLLNDKGDVVEKLVSYLRGSEGKYEARIDFLIEKTLVAAMKELRKSGRESQSLGRFSAMTTEEFSGMAEAKPKDETEVVNDFIFGISKRLKDDSEEESLASAAKEFGEFVKGRDNDVFFFAFFVELITNQRVYQAYSKIFFSHLLGAVSSLASILASLKEELGMLAIDFPIASTNYVEFLCHLKGAEAIDREAFEGLKTNEFSKKAERIAQRWREENDPRYSHVFE